MVNMCCVDELQGFFDHGVVGMTRTGRCVWLMKVRSGNLLASLYVPAAVFGGSGEDSNALL